MQRVTRLVWACAILVIGVSCQQHKGGISPSENGGTEVASAAAAATRPTGLALRATRDWMVVLSLQQEYLAKEGAAHRGPEFARLVMGLYQVAAPAVEVQLGPPRFHRKHAELLSEREVFAVLGPPDYWDSLPVGSAMVYNYRRDDSKGAAADWR